MCLYYFTMGNYVQRMQEKRKTSIKFRARCSLIIPVKTCLENLLS